jgi:hypothetical protein
MKRTSGDTDVGQNGYQENDGIWDEIIKENRIKK